MSLVVVRGVSVTTAPLKFAADSLFPTLRLSLREVRTPTATYCFDPGGLLLLGGISGGSVPRNPSQRSSPAPYQPAHPLWPSQDPETK